MRGLTLTPSARAWLRQTTAARVLSSFDQACNLINQDGALLSLVTSERGLNPFALLVSAEGAAPFQAIHADSHVSVTAGALALDHLPIAWDDAEVWDPRPEWEVVRAAFAPPALLSELADMALALSTRPSLLDLYQARPNGSALEEVVLKRARATAQALVKGIAARSLAGCRAGAQGLAGLGSGLTPAGDDFIMGVLLAIWAGLFGAGAVDLCLPMAEAAAPRTHALSAAYLRAAAQGECPRHWHVLFQAVSEYNHDTLRAALQAVLASGHSSGADALAGFVAVRRTKLDIHS
jgi:hypothetical protein